MIEILEPAVTDCLTASLLVKSIFLWPEDSSFQNGFPLPLWDIFLICLLKVYSCLIQGFIATK